MNGYPLVEFSHQVTVLGPALQALLDEKVGEQEVKGIWFEAYADRLFLSAETEAPGDVHPGDLPFLTCYSYNDGDGCTVTMGPPEP